MSINLIKKDFLQELVDVLKSFDIKKPQLSRLALKNLKEHYACDWNDFLSPFLAVHWPLAIEVSDGQTEHSPTDCILNFN